MEGLKAGRKRCGACFPAQPFWRPHPPSGGGITVLLWNGGCCPKRSLSAACVVLCENTSQGALGFYKGPTIANSKVCADWRPLHPRGLEQTTPLRNSSCIQVGWEAERLCVHIVGLKWGLFSTRSRRREFKDKSGSFSLTRLLYLKRGFPHFEFEQMSIKIGLQTGGLAVHGFLMKMVCVPKRASCIQYFALCRLTPFSVPGI